MNILEFRALLKGKSIYDVPLRVTYYARVSSEKDEQLNSLSNQMSYYQEKIRSVPNWTYVDGYVDEGVTGIATRKREEFLQMIDDAMGGKFDLILTKEISRFARNTVDSLTYTRELLRNGVCVLFENDNINTADEDSEFRLTIMSSVAQEEIRKLSSRVRFGQKQAVKKNVVFGNSRIFGYEKKDKHLAIVEYEAEMIRLVFSLYSTGEYSLKSIEGILWEKGYRNRNGNMIAHNTLSNIIANPKYKGYYVGNKAHVIDMFTKQRVDLPEEEWVMFKDESGEIVPAIVSEDVWNMANAVLKRRSEDVGRRKGICNHPNVFTGKIFCESCGYPYYLKSVKTRNGEPNGRWVCSGKVKNGKDSCPSFALYENDLKKIVSDAFGFTKEEIDGVVDEYAEIFNRISSRDEDGKKFKKLEQNRAAQVAKRNRLLELNVSGKLSESTFLEMFGEVENSISIIDNEMAEIRKAVVDEMNFTRQISEFRAVLEEAARDIPSGIVTKKFVDTYIEKIYVKPTSENEAAIRIITKLGGDFVSNIKKKRSGDSVPTGKTLLNIFPTGTLELKRRNRHVAGYETTYRVYYTISVCEPSIESDAQKEAQSN